MTEQLDYIIFLYGLGFFILAAICALYNNKDKQTLPWTWLGGFGLLQGLYQWLNLINFIFEESFIVKVIKLCILVCSYIFLFEFARISTKITTGKNISRWLTFIFLGIGCIGSIYGFDALKVAINYCLGFAGGLWAAFCIIVQYRKSKKDSKTKSLFYLGILLIVFSIINAVNVPKISVFPASSLNQDTFIAFSGFPLELVLSFVIFSFAFLLWQILDYSPKKFKIRIIFSLLLFITLFFGWLFTNKYGNTEYVHLVEQIKNSTNISAKAIDISKIENDYSTFIPENLEYNLLNQRLRKMKNTSTDIRYVYLMTVEGNKIYFIADNIPFDSPEYEPYNDKEGNLYRDAPEELKLIVKGKQNVATSEYKDEWGNWLSAFAVVQYGNNGKPSYILGIDYPINKVKSNITFHRLQGIGLTLVLIFIFTILFYYFEKKEWYLEYVSNTNKQLQEKEEYLANTLHSIGDGVISTDSNGNINRMNEVAERLTGWKFEDAKGLHITEVLNIVNTKTREAFENPAEKALKEGIIVDLANHTTLISKDGTEYHIADSCSPIRDNNKDIIGAVLVFRDVSEEYRRRKELAQERKRLEFILGITKTGINITDSEYNLRYVDPEWQKIYGDYKGKKCYEYFMDQKQPCEGCGVPNALITKQALVTEEILPKENNRIVEVHTIPFENEDGEWLVAEFNIDITERKQLENAIRESEEKHRLLIEHAVSAFAVQEIIFDEDGNPIDFILHSVNKAFETHTGLKAEDVIGRKITKALPGFENC
ncbi:MAG: PAS domain S-box protein, partial [Armatimonadota bacterium]